MGERAAGKGRRGGLVVVDKPAGWTSHDVVARMRKIYGLRRVGHAGTLDPDATGVLLVGLGRATRLLRFLTETGKVYRGEVGLRGRHRHPRRRRHRDRPAGDAGRDRRRPRRRDPPLPRHDRADPAHGLGHQGRRPPAPRAGPGRGGGRTGAPDGADRPDRGRGVQPRRVPPGPAARRVRQRHLHPEPGRRPRGGARGLRPPRLAAPPAGRAVPGRGGPDRSRRSPRAPTRSSCRWSRRSATWPGSTSTARPPGASPTAPSSRSRPSAATRPARSPSSGPTAGSSPCTRRAGRRPGRSSCWPDRGRRLSPAMHVVTSLDACPDPPAGRWSPSAPSTASTSATRRCSGWSGSRPSSGSCRPPSSPSTGTRPRWSGPSRPPSS